MKKCNSTTVFNALYLCFGLVSSVFASNFVIAIIIVVVIIPCISDTVLLTNYLIQDLDRFIGNCKASLVATDLQSK